MNNAVIYPDDIILAPMAEISHSAFRRLCTDFGGFDWYFTEMLSAPGLVSTSIYTPWYFDFGPEPQRTFVQLAGSEPEMFYQAAEKILAGEPESGKVAGIDINMGCSVHHIRKRGWGVELMDKPASAFDIIKSLKPLLGDRSLSVKLRIGKEEDPDKLLRFCESLVNAGIAFITLNPKTSRTNRNRPGDWRFVQMLREKLPVPVVGNGEIRSLETCASRRRTAGPGPIMIGRAAVQKPWLAAELKANMARPPAAGSAAGSADSSAANSATAVHAPKSLFNDGRVDLTATIERFFDLLKEYQPEDFHISRARRFFFYFCDNFKFGYQVKMAIQHAPDLSAIRELVFGYLQRNPQERYRPLSTAPVTRNV